MDQSRRASAPWSYKAFVLALLFALANLLNLFGHLMALFVIATPFPFIAKEGFENVLLVRTSMHSFEKLGPQNGPQNGPPKWTDLGTDLRGA